MFSVEVEGVDKLVAALKAQTLKYRKGATAEIGYRAPYALFVHEDIEEKWRGLEKRRSGSTKGGEPHTGVLWGTPWGQGGESKFLEKALKRHADDLNDRIAGMLKNHRSLIEAVTNAAYWVLNEANRMVPVDTGRLYESGYVKVTED